MRRSLWCSAAAVLAATLGVGCSLLDWSGLESGPSNATQGDSGGTDGASLGEGGPGDAGADATVAPRCNPSAPFSTPVLVPGPVNDGNENEVDGFLTPDELTIYFARDHGDGASFDIFVARRPGLGSPFGDPKSVPGLSSTTLAERTPFLSRDGKTMFLSTSGSDGKTRIQSAASDGSDGFGPLVELTALSTVSPGVSDPFFLANGTTFYFTDEYDEIPMTATAQAGSFTAPVAIAGLPQPAHAPKVTDDDLTVMFAAPPSSGVEPDIFIARRAKATDGFGDIQRVAELSTPDRDALTWISADGCHVVVSRRASSSTDLYFAERGP